MFDFAWSEMAVIAVVALIAIGPKDMPVAIRAVTNTIKKARRMAAEFQTHVDEMVREANLEEVRQSLHEIRNFDVSSAVERHVDPDHSIRDSFSDPFKETPVSAAATAEPVAPQGDPQGSVAAEVAEIDRSEQDDATERSRPAAETPAFIPPGITVASQSSPRPDAPAFIPPSIAQQHRISA
jgi:sec-independent protein translocase protein TatB